MISHTTNSTTGSAIASYSESETEWIDRTMTLKIPTNSESSVWSESNEWDIVSGKGESGGARSWDFKYQPEEKSKPYQLNIPNTSYQLDGTSTLSESLSGFYSDTYQGGETYHAATGAWDLISGRGGGNGENKFTNSNKLDAYFLGTVPYDASGNYKSCHDVTNAETFMAEYMVEDGAWERAVVVKNINTEKTGYGFDVEESYTSSGMAGVEDLHGRSESGKRDYTTKTTDVWRPGTQPNSREWISYEQDITDIKKDHAYNFKSNDLDLVSTMFDQEYTHTIHKEGMSPWNFVETFDINGTASGKAIIESGYDSAGVPGTEIIREFRNGRIYRDPTTNTVVGMSEAKSFSNYVYRDPTYNHDWKPINYNGFTNFVNNVDTTDPKTIKRDFAPPHVMYLASWMGYSGSITLNYSGNGGVGVTFGEPITIPEGTFDTGIEKYLPKQEPPKYEPKDVTGIGTAVDPTWTNTIWAVLEGGLLGADAGAGEVFYKFSLPFAWISGQENSEFAWLRQGRDAAWVASGLDGTGTQYWTQCSANVAVSAFYSAAALEGAAYVGITEVGHATSVRCAYTTVLVQDC